MAVDASDSARAPRKLKDTRYNVFKLLLIGLVFHLVYIGSVFDCYFTSPVVSGMESYHVGTAEAKRLVLIVGAPSLPFLTSSKKTYCELR
jgi:phosphatidylinositol glycan class N